MAHRPVVVRARRATHAAIGLLMFATASIPLGASAQSGTSGEELYTDYFGCWTCHGPRGEGGDGRPIRGTYLPLSLFTKELRLPAGEMPPFSDLLATDAELATVYAWLDGADAVAQPLPLTLGISADGDPSGASGVELMLTTRGAEPGSASQAGAPRFRHRVTLMARDNSLIADRALEIQSSEGAEWDTYTTDRYGQLLMGPASGTALSDLPSGEGARARLRLTLPEGTYVLVVEGVSTENPGDPTILGVGSWVVTVESSRVER